LRCHEVIAAIEASAAAEARVKIYEPSWTAIEIRHGVFTESAKATELAQSSKRLAVDANSRVFAGR